MPQTIGAALDAIRGNRRDVLRIAGQTACATVATYFVITWLGAQYLSWAVIAALFTIGISADAAYYNAIGRIGGAVLGAALGLAAASALGGSVLIGLVIAATLANMIATIWPSLRYAAVTSAIVALDPSPEIISALERAGSIMIGTLVGAASSFLIWPVFGRQRTLTSLRRALDSCEGLLEQFERGVGSADRKRRDALHSRFLKDLETARSRLSETRFAPALPNGIRLSEAARSVENLWHALVILDRAITSERHEIDKAVLDRLRPLIGATQREARAYIARASGLMMRARDAAAPNSEDLREVIAQARDGVAEIESELPQRPAQQKALHALTFALNETERSLLQLASMMETKPAET